MSRILERWWAPLAVFLLALIAAGVAFLFVDGGAEEPLVILPPPPSRVETVVYVGGAVEAPGLYPLQEGDTLDDLLKAAGGTTSGADLGRVRILVPERGQDTLPQRININTAEPWLLEALPGIGPKLAQAIVDNRPYQSIRDVTRVKGIGPQIYERIKDRITVGEAVPERGQEAPPQKININTAELSLLETLPGIGPKLAQAIVDNRPYQSIRDVTRVKGIGPKTYEKIKDRITVGEAVPERGQEAPPQKININTAEPWLLETLPGIGPKLAQAIVDNRPYQSIRDVTRVQGIGSATYEKIKDLITVGD